MVWLCKALYVYISKDVETRSDTSNCKLNRPLHKWENKNVNGLMKSKLRGKIMTKCFTLRSETYSYLKDIVDKNKKEKRHKKVYHKTKT